MSEPGRHELYAETGAWAEPTDKITNSPRTLPSLARNWLNVDLSAVAHNVRTIKNHLNQKTQLLAVVKANAYGHGMVPVARAALFAGATSLGVASVAEGLELRSAGLDAPVLILGPVPAGAPWERELALEAGLTFSVSSLDEIHALAADAERLQRRAVPIFSKRDASFEKARVHLLIDTGMCRAGLLPEETRAAADLVLSSTGLRLEGIFTHFANAEDKDGLASREQLARFKTALQALPSGLSLIRHAANSAAAVFAPESHFEMVRCGALLHGMRGWDASRDTLDVRPTLSWHARILHVAKRPAGSRVGYGQTYVCKRESWLAMVDAGYRDGYPRALSNYGEAIVRGVRVPVAGIVSMDSLMLDVSELANSPAGLPVAGEAAQLLGCAENGTCISVEELAQRADTIPYTLTTQLPVQLERHYANAPRLQEEQPPMELRKLA